MEKKKTAVVNSEKAQFNKNFLEVATKLVELRLENSLKKLAERMDLAGSYFNGLQAGKQRYTKKNLDVLCSLHPEINREFVSTGQGSMFSAPVNYGNISQNVSGDNNTVGGNTINNDTIDLKSLSQKIDNNSELIKELIANMKRRDDLIDMLLNIMNKK